MREERRSSLTLPTTTVFLWALRFPFVGILDPYWIPRENSLVITDGVIRYK